MLDWIQTHIPPWVYIAIATHFIVLGTVAYLILLERKVASWAQDRLGPNRVGPRGLLQPIADGLKFILKEDYAPGGVDKRLFTLAPAAMIIAVVISIAVVPWAGIYKGGHTYDITSSLSPDQLSTLLATNLADPQAQQQAATTVSDIVADRIPVNSTLSGSPTIAVQNQRVQATASYTFAFQPARLNIGVLFVIATLSMAVYGVVIGGWASNNKYSFLGGLRATAQMVSYEIPLGLSLLCIVVTFGTLQLDVIVEKQAHYWLGFIPAWNVFTQPVAFVLFLTCMHAEANRAPFDLAECEQELVGGYHTEYSSMRFAMFFLAEYAGMITTSAVCVALFFGGWHFWGLDGKLDPTNAGITDSALIIALRCLVYFLKTVAIIFVFMWTRWSLPRFRFDQLMMLAWRGLIPISLALLMLTAVTVYFVGGSSDLYQSMRQLDGRSALIFLGANIAFVIVTMIVSRIIPAAPNTNRRVTVINSRFNKPAEA